MSSRSDWALWRSRAGPIWTGVDRAGFGHVRRQNGRQTGYSRGVVSSWRWAAAKLARCSRCRKNPPSGKELAPCQGGCTVGDTPALPRRQPRCSIKQPCWPNAWRGGLESKNSLRGQPVMHQPVGVKRGRCKLSSLAGRQRVGGQQGQGVQHLCRGGWSSRYDHRRAAGGDKTGAQQTAGAAVRVQAAHVPASSAAPTPPNAAQPPTAIITWRATRASRPTRAAVGSPPPASGTGRQRR